MKYDFETQVSRKGTGSAKWNLMYSLNPNVGDDIVPLSVADMELKNPPEIIEAMKKFLDTAILGYTMPTDDYYNAVTGWMERRHGWKVEKDWILYWGGVVPALKELFAIISEPDDGIVVMTPVYYPFYRVISHVKCRAVENPLIYENGRYTIDFDDLEQKAKDPRNKFMLMSSPHNPVGRCWTKEELTRIGRICIDNDMLIISDEIHLDLMMPGFKHIVFASISEEFAQHSIVCTAPSKTFNLAGLQVSNIMIPNKELRDKVMEARGHASLNALAYPACVAAYNDCEEWLEQLLNLLDKNRRLLEDYIAENIPKVRIIPLEATYLQWLDFSAFGISAEELEKFMINEAELFIDEGYIFGEAGRGFERISLACPSSTLLAALTRLKNALDKKGLL